MAYTLEQVEALQEAIASGALKVKYLDREVTYQTTGEMLKALSTMKDSLVPASQKTGGRTFGAYSKGFK